MAQTRQARQGLLERLQRFLLGDDIFISYSRADGAVYAAGLANELVQLKFSCRIDQWGTQSGREIPRELRRALRRSALLVLVGTQGAAGSALVTQEIQEFRKTGRMIVPVIFDGVPVANGVVFEGGVKTHVGKASGAVHAQEALWAREIEGLPLSPEKREFLEMGTVSPMVVSRIEKTFKFTRRDQRLRRTFVGLTFTLLVIFAVVTAWGANTVQQADEAEKRRTEAERQRVIAEAQTRKAEDELRRAQGELERAGKQLATAHAEKEKADELRGAAESKTEAARRLEAAARRNADEQSRRAEEQRRIASSRELAASASAQLTTDPETSVLLASEAYRMAPTSQAADALRHSMLESRLQAVVNGHARGAAGAAFHPSGNLAATAGEGRTIIVWQVKTGRTVATLTARAPAEGFAHLSWPRFSPDGKYLVAAGSDSTAFLWEWEDEKRRDSPKELAGLARTEEASRKECEPVCVLRTVAFSPDSRYVATAGDRGVAWVWKTGDGVLLGKFLKHTQPIKKVRFSPDGKYVATAADDGVWQWDWKAAQAQGDTRQLPQAGLADSLAYDHGGEYLAVATKLEKDMGGIPALVDYHVKVYGVKTGEIVVGLSGHESFIWDVSFSPDGKYILTASNDGTARVYNWKNPERRQFPVILRGHDGAVYSAAFSPEGEYVVTCGSDRTARLWKPGLKPSVVERKAYSSVPPWLGVLRGHKSDVVTADFSPDGRHILTSSHDGTARSWRAEVERVVATLPRQGVTVESAAFSEDSRFVVTTGGSTPVRVWRATEGEQTPFELIHPAGGEYFRASFSPDGKYVAAGSRSGGGKVRKPNAVLIWEWAADAKRNEPLAVTIAEDSLFDFAFSHDPDGRYLLTTSGSWLRPAPGVPELPNVVRIWDWKAAGGPQVLATIGRFERPVFSVAFSRDPESRYVAVAGWGEVLVYDWRSRGVAATPISLKGFPTPPVTDFGSVIFSPDGKYVAATSFSGAMVWDWQTADGRARPVLLRPGPTRPGLKFGSVAFSRDSGIVATVSSDDTVDLWDPRTGGNLGIVGEGSYNLGKGNVAFSRDGLLLLTTYRTAARIYRCEECRLADELLTLVPDRVSPQAWQASTRDTNSSASGTRKGSVPRRPPALAPAGTGARRK